ncbi:MAG: 2-iminoacetate synthase ThiH [Smithellaceae bacterium]|nr:2-iminoacetate synthase ThiH [Smithellaceae bacterium]
MSFYDVLAAGRKRELASCWQEVTAQNVRESLGKERPRAEDLLALLSPAAGAFLEEMARRAREITRRQFGQVIHLYTPLYLADYCQNSCLYCGFSAANPFPRRVLSLEEVEREATAISETGIQHVLALTGESRRHSPPSYIGECVTILRDYFPSVSAEIYPLTQEEYGELVAAGLDGVTIYQEVYDEEIYRGVHPEGPKKDFHYRLETPERICRAGARTINIGALLGLNSWRSEAFWTARHADWLQDCFPGVEVSLSVPRLQPHLGNYTPRSPVSDRELVQIILAFRIYLPRAGITISTREKAVFRDNLVGLGITRMSAGSRTDVGGHAGGDGTKQFEMADGRNVDQIREMILRKGYQPVFRDWA